MKIKENIRDYSADGINLNGKSILVTGATGSFGKALVNTVINRYSPKKLIIFSRDELKQLDMSYRWPPEKYDFIRYFIGDVRDKERLMTAMHGVDYVIHAAALKQVSAAEYNPFECINTNVIGAENVVQAAIHNKVKRVIALSTDKAANPINLYGASKLASDKIFIAANNFFGDASTKFSVVRYGNVIGSRGSVIPYFQDLISKGAEALPITDPRMTRFWITLEQGVDFVLSCMNKMKGCEVFVPKIASMKITDLASYMAPDLPQKNTGIRPGEKLHEVLISIDDGRQTIEFDDRYIICPSFPWWDKDSLLESGGSLLKDGFTYTSDNNIEWLNKDSILKMISTTDIKE